MALYYSNKVVMHCNKVSFQELLDSFDDDFENNAWNLEHNAEKL